MTKPAQIQQSGYTLEIHPAISGTSITQAVYVRIPGFASTPRFDTIEEASQWVDKDIEKKRPRTIAEMKAGI